MNKRKLLLHEKVEVRQFEEGLQGSWHLGVVVDVSDLCRSVEYDEFLSEEGDGKLIESIPVTKAIEGQFQRRHVPLSYRGRIRPWRPPSQPDSSKPHLSFGTCVDVFFEDAWWEGVVFDSDVDSMTHSVYFPDEGDQRKFNVSDLRISHEWVEFLDCWEEKGLWILVNLAKEHGGDAHFVKLVWCRLRLNCGFMKMISEWTCGSSNLWSKYFMDVLLEMAVELSRQDLVNPNNPTYTGRESGMELMNSRGTAFVSCLHTSDAQAKNSNGFKDVRSSINRKEKESRAESKQKKHSLKKLKSKKPKHPVFNSINKCSFQAENSCRETQLAAGSSLIHGRLVTKGINAQVLNGCSGKNVERNCVFLPSHGDQLLRMENGGRRPKPLDVCERKDEQSLVDGHTKEMETTSDVHLSKRNTTGQGDCKRNKSECVGQNKRKISLAVISKRKPHLVKRSSTLTRLKPFKGNLIAVDKLVMEKDFAHDVSHVQENHSAIKRRKQSQPEQRKSNHATGFSICSQRQTNCKVLNVHINQKDYSRMGKVVPKKLQRGNDEFNLSSEEEDKELGSMPTEDNVIITSRHRVRPFTNSGNEVSLEDMVSYTWKRKRKRRYLGCHQNDTVCMACHYGGDLILCDHCPSAYHLTCINLKDVPDGKWYCPTCRCGICGVRHNSTDDRLFTDVCHQCTRQYHVDCLSKAGFLFPRNHPREKFCSQNCFELCACLHRRLGLPNPTNVKGLTWTFIRSGENDYGMHDTTRVDTSCCLSRAREIMQECFQPVIEPLTKRDLVLDVIFNSVSRFKRLDFGGFYVMVLQNGDELVSVATVRIHGQKVAEMSLVGTQSKYRRQGMCRLLVLELEKVLMEMGIERLVLPAISGVREIWKTSFGFTETSLSERLELLGYPLLVFQGTKMLQKVLKKPITAKKTRGMFF